MIKPVTRQAPAFRAFSRQSIAALGLTLLGWFPLSAEVGAELRIDQSSGQHVINWPTRTGHSYHLESSTDLQSWDDTWIIQAGTGESVAYPLPYSGPRRFYRVRETMDSNDGSFLVLPEDAAEVDLETGVCFAVDLGVFPELPARIQFYKRPAGTGATWEIIGTIREFAEIDEIRFVRGSAIWIPETPGEYEVQAAAVDESGTVMATAIRSVLVADNDAPMIVITDGPPSPSPTPLAAHFTTQVSDTEHNIRYVEFYDNGVLIGTDDYEPFGDLIAGSKGETYGLLRGTHLITAKAYDQLGAIGETAQAFEVVVTEGNARPELTIESPEDGCCVLQGDELTISFALADADGEADLSRVDALDVASNLGVSNLMPPLSELTIDTTGWEPGSHIIHLSVTDVGGAASYPQYIHIYVSTYPEPGFAEMLVANITDPVSAAPSNAAFTGIERSSAEFEDGLAAGLQLDAGIVLTSGLAALWNGGDISNRADESLDRQFPNFEEPGDPVLDQRVAGFRTVDAAVLEFDVFCTEGQLEIEYQFGSEEYDDWVGEYNDAFLVMIDGVATSFVPDCSDIVAVSSVNAVAPANEHLYLDDDQDILPTVPAGSEPTRVEYDGMTIRLFVHAFVTPNRNHRVRLVIADVNDGQLDSALLIGAGSVRSVSPMP